MKFENIVFVYDELSYIASFFIGLLGGVHCFGMCGGVVSALSFCIAPEQRKSKLLLYQICYNLGRISSYVCVGFIAGSIGFILFDGLGFVGICILKLFSGLILILLGLYLGGWFRFLMYVEQIGLIVWSYLYSYIKNLLPVRTLWQGFLLGMIWGYLPCGLVYSGVMLAISSGSWYKGSILMICFGIGTIPVMVLTGFMALRLSFFIKNDTVRKFSGLCIILIGILDVISIYFIFQTNSCH